MTDWKRAAAKHVRCGMSSFSCEVHHGLQGRCNPAKNNHFWVFCGLGALRIAPLVHHGLHPWCIVIGGGIWHRFSPPFLTYRALADENVAVISFHWTDGFVKVGSIKGWHAQIWSFAHFYPNPLSPQHEWNLCHALHAEVKKTSLTLTSGRFIPASVIQKLLKKGLKQKISWNLSGWNHHFGVWFFFDPTPGEYINIHIRSYPSHIPHTIIYYITLTPTSSILSVQKEGNTPQISYGLDLGRIIYQKGREENTTGRERTAMCAEVSKHTPSWCFGG